MVQQFPTVRNDKPANLDPQPAVATGGLFVRIRIGDLGKDGDGDIFTIGDKQLKACSVTLAEGAGMSGCTFEVYDRNRQLANKYFETIYALDGLDPALLPAQNTATGSRTNVNSAGAGVGGFDSNAIQQAVDFYAGQGFSPYAIAAMVGNALQESGLNPQAVGTDQGTGFAASEGIFQWTFERKDGMPADLAGQLQFSITEMQSDGQAVEAGTYNVLRNPNSSQAQIQSAIQSWIRWGTTGGRWDFAETIYQQISGSSAATAASSVQQARTNTQTTPPPTVVKARTGQQITVELGHNGRASVAYSFLHIGLEFDPFTPNSLIFTAQAATWVMHRHKRNTAYVNLSFKQIAQKICDHYNVTLNMEEDGPTYEYFPQRGISDYEALLIEARRLGMRIQCRGNVLTIATRPLTIRTNAKNPQSYEEDEDSVTAESSEDKEKKEELTTNKNKDGAFILSYGINLNAFKVTHSGSNDSSGARSSDPNDRSKTGQKKSYVDPGTGELVQLNDEEENEASSSAEAKQDSTESSTGGHLELLAPLQTTPADPNASQNELRVRGIQATFETDTLPEFLELDPDCAVVTQGITEFLDRSWVVESVTHDFADGEYPKTSGSLYTPLKNKRPQQQSQSTSSRGLPLPPGCRGAVATAAAAYKGSDTSAGPGAGNLACVYAVNRVFENAELTPPWGSSEYVPTAEEGLITSGATAVPQGQEEPGDIVIWDGQHIGVVLDRNRAISNSSSAASFQWETDITADGYFSSVVIYRLNC